MVIPNWLSALECRAWFSRKLARVSASRRRADRSRERFQHRSPAMLVESLEPRQLLAAQAAQMLATPPQVTGLSTHAGSTLGGNPITITGSGFNSVSAVMFDTTLVTSYTVNSSSSITVTTPAHAAGTVDVTVVTMLGSSSRSPNDQFTFQVPTGLPTITGVSPGTATLSGGTPITITGSNFTNVTSVLVGNTPALNVSVTSPTTISAIAPSQSTAGQVDVRVITTAGTSSTSAADTLIYTTPVLPPAVTGLSVSSGSTAGGNSVTLIGTNFANVSSIHVGSTLVSTYTVNSTSSLTLVMPAAVNAGAVDVTVTNSAGTSGLSPADQYTYVSPAPVVSGLSVTSGYSTGGTPVTITGLNLAGATAVWFGSLAATSFRLNSPTSITAISPAAPVGTVEITVQTPNGISATSAADRFTYLTPPPTVTGLSVNSGLITGGATVVISGTQLPTATGVLFGTLPAASYTINSNGTITAVSPAAGLGPVDIQVVSSTGTSAVTAADRFLYVNPPAILSSLSQSTGSTGGGDIITLTGSRFLGATDLLFGSTPAPSFTVSSDGTIVATTPTHSAGTVDVTVVNSSGTSATSAATRYNFLTTAIGGAAGIPATPNVSGLPVINGLDTVGGTTAGGTTVRLYGTGFTPTTKILFGTVPASSFQLVSDNELLATAPAQAAGTLNITVQTPAGSSTSTAASQFTVSDPTAKPVVSSAMLSQNSSGAGSFLTVVGNNFSGTTQVTVGGKDAAYVINSPTSLVAIVPAGLAGAANVAVTTPNGTSAAGTGSAVTLDAIPLPLTTTSIPSPTGANYIVDINRFSSQRAIPLPGPPSPTATAPTPPAVPQLHPVSSTSGTSLTTSDGAIARGAYSTTTTDSGTITLGDNTSVTTQADGSILIIRTTGFESFTYASWTGGTWPGPGRPGSQSSSLDIQLQTTWGVSTTILATHGTGETRFTSTTTTQSWHSTTNTVGTTNYSSNLITTSIASDQANGHSRLGATDYVTASLLQTNTISHSSTGTTTAGGVTNGQTRDYNRGSDSLRITQTNDSVTITSSSGTTTISSSSGGVTPPAPPEVLSVLWRDTDGTNDGAATVALIGRHFTGATAVLFDQVPAPSFQVCSDSSLIAVVPAGVNPQAHVTVIGASGTSTDTGHNQPTASPSWSSLLVDLSSHTLLGSDQWSSQSTDTFTRNPDASQLVTANWSGETSGRDTYDDAESLTWIAVTPLGGNSSSASGSTTNNGSSTSNGSGVVAGSQLISLSSVSSDRGWDGYRFTGSGSLTIGLDGTRASVDNHNRTATGQERQLATVSGWTKANETLIDGTVMTVLDVFGNSSDHQSDYANSDLLAASTASGGTDLISSTSNDRFTFSTFDRLTASATQRNAYGTPTTVTTLATSNDTGLQTSSNTIVDRQTLGVGVVLLEEAISFTPSSVTNVVSNDSLTITIAINGQVGEGEFLNSTETLTARGTSTSSITCEDPGTETISSVANPNSSADDSPTIHHESDRLTFTATVSTTEIFTDEQQATQTTTKPDGTTLNVTYGSTSSDTITSRSSETIVNQHSEVSGSGATNPSINDDTTWVEQKTEVNQYTQTELLDESWTIPIPGGSLSGGCITSTHISGTQSTTDNSQGETSTANPANNQQTETLTLSNIDQGDQTDQSWLQFTVTDPGTGILTAIQSHTRQITHFADQDQACLTSNLAPGSTTAVETEQMDSSSTSDGTATGDFTIQITGSPAAGVMLDSMETRVITGQRRSSEELTYRSSATGSATETGSGTDTFRSDILQSTTTTGHVRITSNQETNPATSGSTSSNETGSNTTGKTSSHETDVLIYGSTSSLQLTNIGSEHFGYENGHLIRDDESDTTTQSIIYDGWQDETISNNAASLQNDPTTGLTTSASATGSSTDHLTSHTIVNLTNIHTASLTNPGSDSTSGTSITTGTEQSTHNASSTIHQTGTLPTGESIDLNNIVVLATDVQTSFTSTGNLAADGTITSTDSSTTTVNIPTIYAAQFGTVRTTAAETGVVTTNAQCAVMDSRDTATNTQTITTVVSPDGTSQSTTTESTNSVTTSAFLLDTITSQVDAAGKPVGLVTTSRYLYADTETVVDGTNQTSTPRIINTSATLPADTTTPQLAVPQPTQLTTSIQSQSPAETPQTSSSAMPIPSFFLPNFERGHLLPFGRFNSINSVTEITHSTIYGIAKFSYDLAYGNYSDDSETKRKEFEAKLAQKNNVESDELLKSLRRQNEKPIPSVYKDLIIEVETAVAGNYGGGSISPGIRPPVGMSRGITPNRPLTADKSISETLKKIDDMVKVGPDATRASKIAPSGRKPVPSEADFVSHLTPSQQYSNLVKSNRPWSWAEDFPGGADLTAAQRRAIRLEAIEKGLIPDVPFKVGTKFPDFELAGLLRRADALPESLWKAGDSAQFDWLDARIPGGRPVGTTWHHSEIPGRMELVDFGPHNIRNHKGGRSPGMWADAPR